LGWLLPRSCALRQSYQERIEEVSAKVRDKGPLKLEADRGADCSAGIVPIAQRLGAPIPDRRVMPRGEREREIGHLSEGTRFAEVLKRRPVIKLKIKTGAFKHSFSDRPEDTRLSIGDPMPRQGFAPPGLDKMRRKSHNRPSSAKRLDKRVIEGRRTGRGRPTRR